MKNKKATYFLVFLVLVVWGLIILKVFNAAGGDDSEERPKSLLSAYKEPYNDYETVKDTAKLYLKYRDPFGPMNLTDKAKIEKDNLVNVKPVVKQQPTNWGFIKYSGFIKNPGSKNLVAMLTINGKTTLLKEGETAEKVKLLKNMQDSIKILFDNKTAFIKIQSGTL